ncbi:Sphingosine N-acyltransferase lag1 [Coemansia sp. RSA 990]|nr:TLC domain-containing protein [Coemansia mojavensis]KAJ1742042.1 Sphingosine N-acyltransferase lag1 [Coemansia sp. RSA 1086]KAJ1873504.1 Sphingosine N-acyltransferase lag1 [Coemansia sp. RSA 990]KAJ2675618.1 Sphingosine N-acyltransferase lag1 [Coemansia sp. RSA 1085]
MTMKEKTANSAHVQAKTATKTAHHSSTISQACQWVVDNQAEWSLVLLALIHAYDSLVARKTSSFVHLKHQIPGDAEGRYYRGPQDIYFTLYWVIAFTLIRVTVMNKVLKPITSWYKVRSSRKVTRFCEQGWLVIYYILSNSAGLYVMSTQPHWLNTRHFWIGYPDGHRQMTALMKTYYLVQMGFWFQQIFVLMIEEKRKDFAVMVTHHIVTCSLMVMSMFMNYTRIGNAILCCMDFSDIFLSGTKCLRYLKMEKASVACFVSFFVSWIYTRHYLYMKIMLSIIFESTHYLDNDNWYPERGSFYNRTIILTFAALLAILQGLIIYWFTLVLKIVYRIIFHSNLEDSRSDSESSDDDGDGNADEKSLKSKKTS